MALNYSSQSNLMVVDLSSIKRIMAKVAPPGRQIFQFLNYLILKPNLNNSLDSLEKDENSQSPKIIMK